MDTPKKKSATKYLLIFIFFIVVVNLIIFANSGEPVQNPVAQVADPMEWAGIYAQINVERNLKTPSSAEFPSLRGSVTDLGEGRYRISSYVDSQNSFGAMIRSEWQATMLLTGADATSAGNWALEELIFDGKSLY